MQNAAPYQGGPPPMPTMGGFGAPPPVQNNYPPTAAAPPPTSNVPTGNGPPQPPVAAGSSFPPPPINNPATAQWSGNNSTANMQQQATFQSPTYPVQGVTSTDPSVSGSPNGRSMPNAIANDSFSGGIVGQQGGSMNTPTNGLLTPPDGSFAYQNSPPQAQGQQQYPPQAQGQQQYPPQAQGQQQYAPQTQGQQQYPPQTQGQQQYAPQTQAAGQQQYAPQPTAMQTQNAQMVQNQPTYSNNNNQQAPPQTTQAQPAPQASSQQRRSGATPPTQPAATPAQQQAQSRMALRARPVKVSGRRIDPSQVPTPSRDLLQENSNNRARHMTSKGIPPYGITNFVSVDDGNANPKFMRGTCTAPVHDEKFLNEAAVQMSLVLAPLQEKQLIEESERVPVVEGRTPVRCKRCRAYISPNAAVFTDLGRKWKCCMCDIINEVSDDYFANLDNADKRVDAASKPELSKGSMEFDVTHLEEYRLKMAPVGSSTSDIPGIPARPLSHLFMLDISSNTQPSLGDLINSLRTSLYKMAELYPMCRVSFITYAASLHFYNFSSPQIPQMIVTDTENPFVPIPFTLMCWLELGSDMARIDQFLDTLPQYAQDVADDEAAQHSQYYTHMQQRQGQQSRSTDKGNNAAANKKDKKEEDVITPPPPQGEACFGAAVKIASLILSESGGKVILTGSKLPTKGLGTIKVRDITKLYGVEAEEKNIYRPIDGFYPTIATECAKRQISFDLLMFANEYCELQTIGQLCHLTGGSQVLFRNYDPHYDTHRLHAAIDASLTQEAGYAAILRVRCSTGLRIKQYHGHFLSQDPHDMDLASVTGSSTFMVDLQHENVLDAKQHTYIQAALLYTTRSGRRRVRVHTLKMPICNTYVSLFRNLDLEACTFAVVKDAIHDVVNKGPTVARTNITDRILKLLTAYRRHCSTGTHSGQLLMPELLKLLPLFSLAIMKSDALVAGTMTPFDDRVQNIFDLLTMPSYRLLPFLYPRFYALHNLYAHTTVGVINPTNGAVLMPPLMQLTADTVMMYGVYLLHDQQARILYLWIGSQVSSKASMALFDCEDAKAVGVSVQFEQFSSRLQNIINYVISGPGAVSGGKDKMMIVHEGKDKGIEEAFFRNMVEDENFPGAKSYSDLLCDLHKKINSSVSK